MSITCYIPTTPPTPTPPGLVASAQPTSSIPVVVPESRYHGNDDAVGIARARKEVGEGRGGVKWERGGVMVIVCL